MGDKGESEMLKGEGKLTVRWAVYLALGTLGSALAVFVCARSRRIAAADAFASVDYGDATAGTETGGDGSGDGVDDGCGCSTTPNDNAPKGTLAAMLLLGVTGLRRRKTRR